MKTIDIVIKITKAGPNAGPFDILTDRGDLLDTNVSIRKLIRGVAFSINENVKVVTLKSIGKCKIEKSFSVDSFTIVDYSDATFTQTKTGCLWRHLTDIQHYNYFYGNIEPYIIEYPFAYQFQDEILQNVKDYTKAYEYLPIPDGIFNYNTKVETNNKWFNKAILYNGQQSSGLLELVAKPINNLQAYNQFPIFNPESKTITYTKSDNFYQYNTFWALQKSSQIPLFNTGCQSLSIDKIINQANMDYSSRSFKKSPLRAKDLRVRHILDNSSSVHLVSQFIVTPSQISYK
jgi:hypothetical protein